MRLPATARTNVAVHIITYMTASFLREETCNIVFSEDETMKARIAMQDLIRWYFNGINIVEHIEFIHNEMDGICFVDPQETIQLRHKVFENLDDEIYPISQEPESEFEKTKQKFFHYDQRLLRKLSLETDLKIVREYIALYKATKPTPEMVMDMFGFSRAEAETVCLVESFTPIYDSLFSFNEDKAYKLVTLTSLFSRDNNDSMQVLKTLILATVKTHNSIIRLLANKATASQINSFNFPVKVSIRSRKRLMHIYAYQIFKIRQSYKREEKRVTSIKEKMNMIKVLEELQNSGEYSPVDCLIMASEITNRDIIQFRDVKPRSMPNHPKGM